MCVHTRVCTHTRPRAGYTLNTRLICVNYLQGLQHAIHQKSPQEGTDLGAPWNAESEPRQSGNIIQDGLELTILPQPSNCWSRRHASLRLSSQVVCFPGPGCLQATQLESRILASGPLVHGSGQKNKRLKCSSGVGCVAWG